jgi:hypothetical protein
LKEEKMKIPKFLKGKTVSGSIVKLFLFQTTMWIVACIILAYTFDSLVKAIMFVSLLVLWLILMGIFSKSAETAQEYESKITNRKKFIEKHEKDRETIDEVLKECSNDSFSGKVKGIMRIEIVMGPSPEFPTRQSHVFSGDIKDPIVAKEAKEFLTQLRENTESSLAELKKQEKIVEPKSYTFWRKAFAFPEEQKI